MTSTVSRLCSSTRRAFVGTKLTTGMYGGFFHVWSDAATREPERRFTPLGREFQCIPRQFNGSQDLTCTKAAGGALIVRNSPFHPSKRSVDEGPARAAAIWFLRRTPQPSGTTFTTSSAVVMPEAIFIAPFT